MKKSVKTPALITIFKKVSGWPLLMFLSTKRYGR
jgi:hypothetical protein